MKSLKIFLQNRKRIKQRATPFSLFVVVLLFGLFFEAYMHNFNLVYITLFFVFATAFSAGPIGIRNIKNIEAKFDGCGRLFANVLGECRIKVSNKGIYTAWALDVLFEDKKIYIGSIKGSSVEFVKVEYIAPKRGYLYIKECKIESLFPLSTVRFQIDIKDCKRVVVYPQPKGIPLSKYLAISKNFIGDESDFDGVGTYSGSESASRIHWASVAKGELAVKKFVKEYQSQKLEFDFIKAANSDEDRLSQLTLWVLECEEAKLDFVIYMPNGILDSQKENIDEILTKFALY